MTFKLVFKIKLELFIQIHSQPSREKKTPDWQRIPSQLLCCQSHKINQQNKSISNLRPAESSECSVGRNVRLAQIPMSPNIWNKVTIFHVENCALHNLRKTIMRLQGKNSRTEAERMRFLRVLDNNSQILTDPKNFQHYCTF